MRKPMAHRGRTLGIAGGIVAVVVVVGLLLSACSGVAAFGDSLNRKLRGVSATMTTYNQSGKQLDRVHGKSFNVSRDKRFDTSNSDGTSKNDSSVLMISLGSSHISHVGSSMIIAEDGIADITPQMQASTVSFENTKPGTPWLNNFIEYNRNLWAGKGKTILVRSQDGSPIAIYAGSQVEILSTDVPKSTWFRVDGKFLFVYRSDYTVYDNDLLK
jgi:hypothetical protein